MKKIDLGQAITIFANLAVLAGIIFLALEFRQNQVLASAQNDLAYVATRNAVLANVTSHAEIWRKGNAGEPLTEAEEVVYLMLLDSYNDTYFSNYLQNRQLGEDPKSRIALTELTYFLYENPGAYEAWEELETTSENSRASLLPPEDLEAQGGIASDFLEFVRSGVKRLRAQ